MRRDGIDWVVRATLAVLLASTVGWAQGISAGLRGTVRSTEGDSLTSAVVTVTDADTGQARTVEVDPTGRFALLLLRPGHYSVEVSAEGYLGQTVPLRLGLGETRQLDLELRPPLVESVVVEGDAPELDAGRTSDGLFLGRETMIDLPLNGRNFTDLALLDSAVARSAPGTYQGEKAALFSVNGQTVRSNSYLIDGASNDDLISGLRNNAFITQEAIHEFRLETNHFAPEYGRASGGVSNVVTRAGGNELTGSLFYQFVNDALGESEPITASLPDGDLGRDSLERQQWAFHLGGPIRHDRAFYFLAGEVRDEDAVTPYLGRTRDGVLGGLAAAPASGENFFGRFDFTPSPDHRLTLRTLADHSEVAGVNVGELITPESGYALEEKDLQLYLSLQSVLTPRLFHEVRLLYSSSRLEQQAASERPGVDRPDGTYGGNLVRARSQDELRLQLVDNLTFVRGAHTIKAGLDFTYARIDFETAFNPFGNFVYDTTEPFEPGDDREGSIGVPGVDDDGDGTIDEPGLEDTYAQVFQFILGEPRNRIEDLLLGLFIQDDWQVNDRLRITYGLRYDLETFELPDDVRVESTIPNGGFERDTDNVAPRASFSLQLGRDRDWLVRGGGGVFFDKLVVGFPSVSAVTAGQELVLGFFKDFRIPIDEAFVEANGATELVADLQESFGPLADGLALRFSTGTDIDTPYNVQWSLGVEHEVAPGHVLGAQAVRIRGYHQPLLVDLNPFVRPGVLGLPEHRDPSTGSIAAIETQGNSFYKGLTLEYGKSRGKLRLQASYTWSRARDESPDPLKGGIYLPPNSEDVRSERARADHDQEHRLVVVGSWDSPLWGVRIAPVLTYSSGLPYNVLSGVDANFDGILSERPPGVDRNSGGDAGLGDPDPPEALFLDVRFSRLFNAEGAIQLEFNATAYNVFNRDNRSLVVGNVLSDRFGDTSGFVGLPRTLELGVRLRF